MGATYPDCLKFDMDLLSAAKANWSNKCAAAIEHKLFLGLGTDEWRTSREHKMKRHY